MYGDSPESFLKDTHLLPGQTPQVSHLIGLGPGSLSATVDSDVCQVLGPTMEEFSHRQGRTVIQIGGYPCTPVPELGWSLGNLGF